MQLCPATLRSSVTFKADCLLGKQETNRFVWFSLIRLKIFLVVVLIQSVSSQISSTLIRNSLAGCAASSAVAGMLLPPAAREPCSRSEQLGPGVPPGTQLSRSIFQCVLGPGCGTELLSTRSQPPGSPLKQLLAASFYSLPSALGLSNFFPATDPSLCLLSTMPLPGTCVGTGGP